MSTEDLVTVTLSSPDGSESKVLLAKADGAERGVLVLPALGIPESYYAGLLRAFRERGVSAAVLGAPQWREGSGQKPPSYGYGELALDLTPKALALLEVPKDGRYLLGHSLGGAVAGIHTGVHGDVAGIVLVAAGTPYSPMYRGAARARTFFGTQLIGAYASLFDYFPGDKAGFGGRMSGKLAREWSSFARTGKLVIDHASGTDAESAMAKARTKVLAVVLARDVLAPERAVRHLVGKLASADARVHTYAPPEGHKEPDHNRWPKDPQPFADIVLAFMDEKGSALPHVRAA